MHLLHNRYRSKSEANTSGKNSNAKEATEWGYSSGNQDTNGKHWTEDLEKKLIKIVNSKISLKSILDSYYIRFEQVYNSGGWDMKCSCPFPDHRDSTPSFGYNSSTDVFNCFGCNRAGRAVEFIAFIENKSKKDAANWLANNYNIDNISAIELENDFNFEELRKILFEYADFVRSFKQLHKTEEAIKYIDDITWNLDVYIRQHSINNSFVLKDLSARIELLKEQVNLFG